MRYALAAGMLMLAVSACAVSRQPPAPAPSPAATDAGFAPSGGAGSLSAVAALAESDAWAVGTHTPLPKGIYPLTAHWDGQRWRAVPCPSPGGTADPTRSSLEAVAIDAPGDAWAVGRWSPIEHNARRYPLIEHWNGAAWSIVPAPSSGGHVTDLDLTAVAAVSPTAAWAIGEGVAGGHSVPVFMGWDGTRWRYLPRPVGTTTGGLGVISARDIWLVGEQGATKSVPKYRTLVEHWNGSKWAIVPAPYVVKGRKPNIGLSAVGGSSSSNVWAVGHYQSGPTGLDISPLVEHWDGRRWQLQPSPNPTGAHGETGLDAIAALSPTSAFAVGSAWGSRGSIPLIERWDGVRWTVMPIRLQPGVTDPTLSGVAAVQPGYAWVVGYARNRNDRPIALVEKWNGTSWQQVPSPVP